jgi:RNA-binding protein
MQLSESQKKRLRGLGHKLKPVVTIGTAGLTSSVLEEFAQSIGHHELMKVKISAGDRDERDRIVEQLCNSGQAQLIQRVGNIGLFMKLKKKDSKLLAQL